MQRLGDRPTPRLPDATPLIGIQVLHLALDLVEPGEVLDASLRDLALVGRVQFDELAPRMREAASLDDALGQPHGVEADQRSHSRSQAAHDDADSTGQCTTAVALPRLSSMRM